MKIKKIVQKMTIIYKDWHEMLPLPHMGIMLHYMFQQGQDIFRGGQEVETNLQQEGSSP